MFRTRSDAFDVLVAALVGALALMAWNIGPSAVPLTVLGLAMAAVLLVRRRRPLTVLAVVSLLALAQVLLYPPRYDPMPHDVAVLIAMYTVVAGAIPTWHTVIAVAPVAAGCGIEAYRHSESLTYQLSMYLAVTAGTWLGAYAVRTRRLYVAGLEERAAAAERERDALARVAVAEERAAIARELHDVIAHSLAVMIVQADGAAYTLDTDKEQARAAIRQVAGTGREALQDMRRLVGVLRHGGPDASAAEAEPRAGADRRSLHLGGLDALVERARSAGVRLTTEVDENRPDLPPALELTAYRLVQEALTNVLRHAGANPRATLRLGCTAGALTIEMVDDGGAGPAREPVHPGGHGLIGMRERAAVHGGRFTAGPVPGGGWRVAATLPLPACTAAAEAVAA
ncbi:sensor histidine kinase [Actinoplanes sp. NPDC049802]|uniref:sensor histidine kinase n=1 Tax=Actinoplanes sp. NPDC049802 TaxID=3154742 RepID=UPI0033E897CD